MQRVVILALVLIVAAAGLCEGLKVGAFNIKIFGKNKLEKKEVVKVLSQVRQPCICFLYIATGLFGASSVR